MTNDLNEEITVEQLQEAEPIGKPLYQTMGGVDVKIAVIAIGLMLRCVVEETMQDPGDEDERTERMQLVMNLIVETLHHPAIRRKMRTQ